MNQFTLNQPPKNPASGCAALVAMAEQELAAFFSAVTELFGSEQAERSAEDWLHEFEKLDAIPSSAPEWRRITVNVSARLADRVNAASMSSASPPLRPVNTGCCTYETQAS